jgi:hypothetical protein
MLTNEQAGHAMVAAHDRLQRLASYGAPYGFRVSAEQQYGEAYQALVRQGSKPQLRRKYRGH